MSCCHHYAYADDREKIFTVDVNAIKFGPGAVLELPDDIRELELIRLAIFCDSNIRELAHFRQTVAVLDKAGIDYEIYDEVRVEPTEHSFQDAALFAREGRFDGYISIGGGSVIDTCKAANLYSTWPASFESYVNAPLGGGQAVPGRLKPHIACPTTCGTGSECTGIAVFDYLAREVKTGIASRQLRPTRAVVDPLFTGTLPGTVVAASGFDVLCHALESYTARPYTQRLAGAIRPLSQGANPYSDIGCREAIRICGQFLQRAVTSAEDTEARQQMMLAATLAGIAFGNSGVHIPHGMSYSVAGLNKRYRAPDYPQDEPLCPHGISVVVNAPAAFRYTASSCPDRHREAAQILAADTMEVAADEGGELLAQYLVDMMQVTLMPNGVGGVGYGKSDIVALSAGAYAQQRLLQNSPRDVSEEDLHSLYENALSYW